MPYANLLKKYEPKSIKQVIGNEKQVNEVTEFIRNYSRGKALILYGPSGCGKNLAIKLIAKELSYELVELTPSDFRDYENLKNSVISASQQMSFSHRKKIILIDEISVSDSGTKKGLKELIKNSSYPVVLITTNPFVRELIEIRQHCKLIKFDKIRWNSIKLFLEKIARNENIKYDDKALSQLARMANGDVRSALIDLEALGEVTEQSIKKLSDRSQEQSVFETLKIIFKTNELENSKLALIQSDKTPDEIFWWLEENIMKEYTEPNDIASAYKSLAYADLFKSLIIKRQAFSLEKYFLDMLTAVSIAKQNTYRKFVMYQPPKFFTQIKKTPKDLITVYEKVGRTTHTSKRTAKAYLPLIKQMIRKKSFRENFTKEEIEVIRKS